jgi:hypothetical protein
MGLVSCNGTANEGQTATSVSDETSTCKFVKNGVGSPGQVQVRAEEVVNRIGYGVRDYY